MKNDTSQALFEIAKGDTPFVVDTRIAYSGVSQSAIVLNRPRTTLKAMRKSPSEAAVSSSSTPTATAKTSA
ncbi:hypothetical protein MJ390_14130 [Klebsiella pneumoniae]|nr:hypothetical protein MJ390_14130 [Klebsiella pneumoniae]